MDADFLSLLSQMSDEEIQAMFQPLQQEQGVLDQEMALAEVLRRPGPQHSSPVGALVGGLSDAVGNIGGAYKQSQALEGQRALGSRMQKDAAGRVSMLADRSREKALEEFLRQRQQGLGLDQGLVYPDGE